MIEQLKKLQFWIRQREASYNDHIEMSTIVSQAVQTLQKQDQKASKLEEKIETLEKKNEALEEKIKILEDERKA